MDPVMLMIQQIDVMNQDYKSMMQQVDHMIMQNHVRVPNSINLAYRTNKSFSKKMIPKEVLPHHRILKNMDNQTRIN